MICFVFYEKWSGLEFFIWEDVVCDNLGNYFLI